MILYLNNLEHGIHIDHLHYNYLAEEQNAAIQLGVQLGEHTDADVKILSSLAHEPITHLMIEHEEKNLYDLEDNLRIVTLLDIIDNGERHVSIELARIEE